MELNKSEFTYGKGKLNKFMLDCKNDIEKYTLLIDVLYKSDNFNAAIIKTLFNNKKNIVLKIGFVNAIKKEYDIALQLREQTNFIRYYCIFDCNDNIINIINNEKIISNYKICNYGNEPIGILIMNYYKEGSIGDYEWNKENLEILKNVLLQTIFALIYAYEEYGFMYGDLHINNILLKKCKNKEINYNNHKIIVNELEAKIMDFEKSKINEKNSFDKVIKNILVLLSSLCYNYKFENSINCNLEEINKLKKINIINEKLYNNIENIILNISMD